MSASLLQHIHPGDSHATRMQHMCAHKLYRQNFSQSLMGGSSSGVSGGVRLSVTHARFRALARTHAHLSVTHHTFGGGGGGADAPPRTSTTTGAIALTAFPHSPMFAVTLSPSVLQPKLKRTRVEFYGWPTIVVHLPFMQSGHPYR